MAATIEPTPYDQLFFDQFRIGTWPNYFDGVQFDRKPETLNQFFRSVTPNTGPYDAGVISDAMSALFDRIGPGILFTHSQAGGPGLADGDQESERQGDRRARAGQRLRLPARRTPRGDA